MADSLIELSVAITRIVVPIIIVVGALGNGLNIIILTRSAFNRHTCSLYFLVMAINNFFYSTILLTFNLLGDGYQQHLLNKSGTACKLISYLLNLCPNISVYLIVLASVDRYFASSSNPQRREWSSVRIARVTVTILLSVLALLLIGVTIIFDLSSYNTFGCIPYADTFSKQVYMIILVVEFAIFAPCLMIIFGLLTIYNATRLQVSITVVTHRRTERQLIRMLLLQLVVHLVLIIPFCTVFIMLSLPINFQVSTLFFFLFVIFKLPFYLSFVTPFFLYILSAQIYRQELARLIKFMVPRTRNNRVHTTTT